jgi:predicted O-methyltransferase YrrM
VETSGRIVGAFRQQSDRLETVWRPEIGRLRIPSLGRSEAELLATIAAARGARRILELGTAIGYSAAYLATGAGPSGHVDAVELDPQRAAVARRLWSQTDLADRITLHEGNALALAQTVGADYDLVFVDLLWELGEREPGRQLARSVTTALGSGGVLVADNCGQTAAAAGGLMDEITGGPFRTTALLPLGNGMFVAVKQ